VFADIQPRDLWRYDFEDGAVPPKEAITFGKDLKVDVAPRADGDGKCLQLAATKPIVFAQLNLEKPITIERNLILAFDHREEAPAGFEGAYLGMTFYQGGKQVFWHSDEFSSDWRHVELPLATLKPDYGVDMKAGLVIDRVQLYARSKDQKTRGDSPCLLKVQFDNLRLYVGSAKNSVLAGKPYTCHNNPPLLDWRGPTEPGQRLEYSQNVDFPPDQTTVVTLNTTRPFYVPDRPLAPGVWYFRREMVSDLFEGWGNIQELTIPEHTHSYRPPALDFPALAAKPRPRLLARIRPDGKPVSETERQSLVRQAQNYLKQGVPEHPGPYVKGDPRWPNWIDWYGQVADKTTAHYGRNLERTARAAILTEDETAIAAAKTLLLAACDWDPKGGSAARYGDLQAASLLKGMVWCYDACESQLSPAEKERVLGILKTRVLQFYTRISPFRINPAQNHPWKKNTIVAESALVLIGVLPEADEWLDVSLHNFAYRILPSMGFDGENQEGIMYWAYGVDMLANFGDLMLYMAGINVYNHPWLARTCRFPMYLAPPSAYAISFADNSSRGNVSVVGPYGTSLAGRLGRRTHDPYALWYAGITDDPTPPRPPADIPQSIVWPYIGYAIFNTCLSEGLENVGVGMRCGPFFAGHQHDDLNGFSIHAYGEKLAVDGGYYDWYGSPHFKAYSITTLAHNTLLVNGQCQQRKANGTLVSHFDSPGFGYAVGDASDPEVYHGLLKHFERRLLFLKPGFVVVQDLVDAAEEPVQLDWLIHSHTKDAFPADSASRTFSITTAHASLHGTFLAPDELDLTVAKSFDVVPQKPRASVDLPWDEVQPEWTLTAATKRKQASGQFLAVLGIRHEPVQTGPKTERFTAPGIIGCRIQASYGSYLVLVRQPNTPAGPVSVRGIETDGEFAAVLLDPDGNLVNAFAAKATLFRYQGKRLFRANAPRNWSMDESVGPVPAQGTLLFADRELPMAGMSQPLPSGNMTTWWANVPVPERVRCRVTVEGWTGKRPPHVRLDNRLLEDGETSLTPGTACVVVTGSGTFDRVVVAPRQYHIVPALPLPKDTAAKPGDIVIDGDTPGPIREGGRKPKVMDKVAATGGKAYCCIDGPIQWAEWQFAVPADGAYQLLVRGASEDTTIDREILIDANPFPIPDSAVRMQGTGGWCRTQDEWGWNAIATPDGKPATVALKKGTHTLRWSYVNGSQNVDLFLFSRVK
jgi:hypothetical protein